MSSSTWRRIGYGASFVIVAGVAASVSYSHITDVAIHGHQSPLIAHLMPLSIDGLMLIATLAMAEDKAASRHPRGWARFSFWAGAAVSTAANVASTVVSFGWEPLGIATAAVAPLALLLAIEIVARPGKPKGVRTPAIPSTMEEMADLPDAPVSPAVVGGERKPYGPRKGDQYSERHTRRQRTGK